MLDNINDDILWVGTDEGVLKINTNNDIINRFDIFESTREKIPILLCMILRFLEMDK